MQRLSNFIKKHYVLGLIIIYILVLTSLMFLIFYTDPRTKYADEFKSIGSDFYENFYYKNIDKDSKNISEFLKQYESIGIKINLENLKKYNYTKNSSIYKEFEELKCNNNSSRVIIYPYKPFKQNDYKINIELECKF